MDQVQNAQDQKDAKDESGEAIEESASDTGAKMPPTVVVAVCTTSSESQDSPPLVAASPVPLPSPAPQQARSAGTLVQLWAEKAGIRVMDFQPTFPPGSNQNPNNVNGNTGTRPRNGSYSKHGHTRVSSDEDYTGNGTSKGNNGRRGSYTITGIKSRSQHEHVSVTEKHTNGIVYGPGRGRGRGHHHHLGGGTLVERPAATMAMNASMMQPSKVIRVLARGEKLDP
jgi:hypothetical protein